MPIPICWAGSPDCSVDWNAWSALGSLAAASAAAFFGTRELLRRRRDDKASAREICSSAEQAVAYREIAKQIVDNPIHYHPQINSLKTIQLSSRLLADSLELLLQRNNLTEGSVGVGVAGKEVASGISSALAFDIDAQNAADIGQARSKLDGLTRLCALLENRAASVRREFGLERSIIAARIRLEYGAMIEGCAHALAAGEAPPEFEPF